MPAVSVQGVGKRFWHHASASPRSWKSAALGGFSHLRGRERFWALKDVSFDVAHGTTLGLMGPNGAGKSTLLRLIGGVGRPDEGRIDVQGRIGSIIELGTGFHPELTGRESVVLTGVIGGLTKRAVVRRLDDVVSFAELEAFIDEPIRTYSSGMIARLAFSIATHIDAEVLLVDEVLAVGDIAFQRRCIDRIKSFQRSGLTLVIVSHNSQLLAELCTETVWLRAGRVVASGAPDEVASRYEAAMAEKTLSVTPLDVPDASTPDGVTLRMQENRFGSQEARLDAVRVVDAFGQPAHEISTGGEVTLRFEVCVPAALTSVQLAAHLIRSDGVMCLDAYTSVPDDERTGERRAGHLRIERLDLAPGDYAFDVGIYSKDWERPYDYHWRAYPLRIAGPDAGSGVIAPPLQWSWNKDVGS